MNAPLTIRRATSADAGAIAEIHVAAWRAAYRELIPQSYIESLSVERRREFWQGALSNPGLSHVALAEHAGVIIGFCSYGPTRDDDDEPGTAEIYSIYVRPDEWRQGAGQALCAMAFRDAAERACPTMTVWVLKDNRLARGFYERVGFSGDGAERSDASRGIPLQEMRYRKAIA